MKNSKVLIPAALLVIFIFAADVYGQHTAVTEKGDTVLLYRNRKWEFKSEYSEYLPKRFRSLDTSKTVFTGIKKKAKVIDEENYALWYNENVWNVIVRDNKDIREYNFSKRKDIASAVLLSRNVPLPFKYLQLQAQRFLGRGDKNYKIEAEEIRKVNGVYVYMQKGIIPGKPGLISMCYLYTNDEITVELYAFSDARTYNRNKAEIEKLLNGLFIKVTASAKQ